MFPSGGELARNNRLPVPSYRIRIPGSCHPYHRLAIEHQNKILDYLTDLLKPFAIDKREAAAILINSVIDGAFSIRMLYWNSKEVPILSPAEAVLKSFQSARTQRRR
jgi:hypothetical protein